MSEKYQAVGVGMTPSKTNYGRFVRAHRLKLDLRQHQLAELVGILQPVISQFEVGKRKYLSFQQQENLARVLCFEPEELRKLMPVKRTRHSQPTTELGRRNQSRREELGLTLQEFADRMGMTLAQAEYLEIGKKLRIGYGTAKLLASVLKLDPSVFADFVGVGEKQTNSVFGGLVRSQRKRLMMTIDELAKKLGVSKSLVGYIESGELPLSENDDLIGRLASTFELDVNDLLAVRPKRRLKQTTASRQSLNGFLAFRRFELNLTQWQVAHRCGIPETTISNIETGAIVPDNDQLGRLSKVLECEIPEELIPVPQKRKRSYQKEARTPLGNFVREKRLTLGLSQVQVARRGKTSDNVVSGIERGTYHPGPLIRKKISKGLECEIPTDLL